MKNISLALLVFFALVLSASAQQSTRNVLDQKPTGEVKLNFLNVIAIGTVEIGYEQFFSNDQSIGLEIHFNDRFSYSSTRGSKSFESTSLQLAYTFYFSGDENGKLFLFPFVRYRFGEFSENIDGVNIRTDMNSTYLGLGGGYRWVFSEKFAFGPFLSVSRGFSQEVAERFAPVEFNAGFTVGYRF
jgi:hypothetical protein